jgi:hypothetical protein
MTQPEPHPLDGLLEEMLPVAAEVTVAVRDRDTDAVTRALRPVFDTGDERRISALIIDLAVMVPDDVPIGDLLLWTHGPVVDDDTYAEIVAFNPQPGLKRCSACREWLPLKSFTRDRSKPGGYRGECKGCLSDRRTRRASAEETSSGGAVA